MRQDAEVLSSIVQFWLVRQSAVGEEIGNAADVERLMERLRQSAGLLIDYYLEGRCRGQAREAYDAGIVAGFYGAASAIAWRGRAGADGAHEADKTAFARGLRRRMHCLGYQQGRALQNLLR